MNRSTFVVALSASLCCAGSAQANFQMRDVRQTITDGGNTYDRVTFYVKNDGVGGTGSRLLAYEFNKINSTAPLHFGFADTLKADGTFTSDGTTDADLFTANANLATATTTKLDTQFYDTVLHTLTAFPTVPNPIGSGSNNVATSYANLSSVYTLGLVLGATNAPIASATAGLPFFTAVVPTGATVKIDGLLGGETGTAGTFGPWTGPTSLTANLTAEGSFPFSTSLALDPNSGGPLNVAPFPGAAFSYTAAPALAPEPASLAMVAGAAVTLVRRRRR